MVMRARPLLALALAGLVVAACKPEFDDRPSEIDRARILAVQSEPAEWVRVVDPDTNEAKPAQYRALVTGPIGTIANADLEWSICSLPKPLTELNDVSFGCFQNDPKLVSALGHGPEIRAALPENACRQFGPDVPEDQSFRPADPDVTGGYYQPVRVLFRPTPEEIVPAIAKVRIRCGLPGASQEQITRYNRSYHPNSNPRIESVAALGPSGPFVMQPVESNPDAPPLALAAGQSVTLRVTWPSCPLVDACGDGVCGPTETKEKGAGQCEADCKVEKACGGAERFLAFSLETRLLDEARETLRVSWFVPRGFGAFKDDRTGRDGADPTTFVDNVYTAPGAPGLYPIWIVLRDNRGGVVWVTVRVKVS